jgi:small subunit ribosomal protein S7e
MSKKEKSQKGGAGDIHKSITNALEKIKDQEKDHKAELDLIKIEHANEVGIGEDNKCYLVQVSSSNPANFKKIHPLLTKKLEEQLSSPVIIIKSRKRVNGKEYRTFVSKKVPRDRTLTAIFDAYLDDILYPATIIGKRIRYPVGKTTRKFKVIVDPLDKDTIEYKIPAMTACYCALTNRKLEIEF